MIRRRGNSRLLRPKMNVDCGLLGWAKEGETWSQKMWWLEQFYCHTGHSVGTSVLAALQCSRRFFAWPRVLKVGSFESWGAGKSPERYEGNEIYTRMLFSTNPLTQMLGMLVWNKSINSLKAQLLKADARQKVIFHPRYNTVLGLIIIPTIATVVNKQW